MHIITLTYSLYWQMNQINSKYTAGRDVVVQSYNITLINKKALRECKPPPTLSKYIDISTHPILGFSTVAFPLQFIARNSWIFHKLHCRHLYNVKEGENKFLALHPDHTQLLLDGLLSHWQKFHRNSSVTFQCPADRLSELDRRRPACWRYSTSNLLQVKCVQTRQRTYCTWLEGSREYCADRCTQQSTMMQWEKQCFFHRFIWHRTKHTLCSTCHTYTDCQRWKEKWIYEQLAQDSQIYIYSESKKSMQPYTFHYKIAKSQPI